MNEKINRVTIDANFIVNALIYFILSLFCAWRDQTFFPPAFVFLALFFFGPYNFSANCRFSASTSSYVLPPRNCLLTNKSEQSDTRNTIAITAYTWRSMLWMNDISFYFLFHCCSSWSCEKHTTHNTQNWFKLFISNEWNGSERANGRTTNYVGCNRKRVRTIIF